MSFILLQMGEALKLCTEVGWQTFVSLLIKYTNIDTNYTLQGAISHSSYLACTSLNDTFKFL